MKATGIVRRIDDLGRVVIPKEIRRTMRIREGDPLEIYTDRDGEVIFKKYSPVGEMASLAEGCAEAIHKSAELSVIVCDKDSVISSSGVPKKDFYDRPITKDMSELYKKRTLYTHGKSPLYPVEGSNYFVSCAAPIVCDGDVIGIVAALSDKVGELPFADGRLISTAANFIASQIT